MADDDQAQEPQPAPEPQQPQSMTQQQLAQIALTAARQVPRISGADLEAARGRAITSTLDASGHDAKQAGYMVFLAMIQAHQPWPLDRPYLEQFSWRSAAFNTARELWVAAQQDQVQGLGSDWSPQTAANEAENLAVKTAEGWRDWQADQARYQQVSATTGVPVEELKLFFPSGRASAAWAQKEVQAKQDKAALIVMSIVAGVGTLVVARSKGYGWGATVALAGGAGVGTRVLGPYLLAAPKQIRQGASLASSLGKLL